MLWCGAAVGLASWAGAFTSQNRIGQNYGQRDRRLSAGLPAATQSVAKRRNNSRVELFIMCIFEGLFYSANQS